MPTPRPYSVRHRASLFAAGLVMTLAGAAAWLYWFTMPLFPAISAGSLAFAAVATVTAIGGLGAAIGALCGRFWGGMFWGAAVASVGVIAAAAVWVAF